ncbi:UNVERIFIED_CONTAM: hypothetical protein RMT77_015412 [Armadillidium vulgare]
MADLEKTKYHMLSKWVENNVLQNVSIEIGTENGFIEYSTVGTDSLPTSTHVFDVSETLQSLGSGVHITPTTAPEALDFQIMLIFGMVVTLSFSIIGSIENLLTIAAMAYQFKLPAYKRYLSKFSGDTFLILNLCIADFIYCAVNLPVMFVIYKNLFFQAKKATVNGYNAIPNTTCRYLAFFSYSNTIISFLTVGFMALERSVTIYRYQRNLSPKRLFSPIKTMSYMAILFIGGMPSPTLALFEKFGRFGYNQNTLRCDFMPTGNASYLITPRVFFFGLQSTVPISFIIIGYFVILMQVYSSNRFITGYKSITTTVKSMCIRKNKTTRLIIVMLTLFLVCVIPKCIYNVAIREDEFGEKKNQKIGIAMYCLCFVHYVANNFIYVISNEKYRNIYRQFFCMILCRDIPSPSTAISLRIPNSRTCRIQTIMAIREHPEMRNRASSEMTIDGFSTRDFLKRSQTQINILSINLNIINSRELPILVYPEAHLTTEKTNLVCYDKIKFSSLSRGSYLKLYDRRSSLHNSKKRAPKIGRSLTV